MSTFVQHGAQNFVISTALGLHEWQAAIIAVVAMMNDIMPWIRWRIAKDDRWTGVNLVYYKYWHNVQWWFGIPAAIAITMFCYNVQIETVVFVAMFGVALTDHVWVDKIYHKPGGGWYWWGRPVEYILNAAFMAFIYFNYLRQLW